MSLRVKWGVVHTSSASAPVGTWVPASLAHTCTDKSQQTLSLTKLRTSTEAVDRALVPVLTHEHLCMRTHLRTSTNTHGWFLLKRALSVVSRGFEALIPLLLLP